MSILVVCHNLKQRKIEDLHPLLSQESIQSLFKCLGSSYILRFAHSYEGEATADIIAERISTRL